MPKWEVENVMHNTRTQKKKPISNEFWNRMKWIKWRTSPGLLNQKWSLDGFIFGTPSVSNDVAASWANRVIMCSSLAPTISRSCNLALSLGISYIQISIRFKDKLLWYTVRIQKRKAELSQFNQHEGNVLYLQIEARKLTRSMCAILHLIAKQKIKGEQNCSR